MKDGYPQKYLKKEGSWGLPLRHSLVGSRCLLVVLFYDIDGKEVVMTSYADKNKSFWTTKLSCFFPSVLCILQHTHN